MRKLSSLFPQETMLISVPGRRGAGQGKFNKTMMGFFKIRIFQQYLIKKSKEFLKYPWSFPGPRHRLQHSAWCHPETGAGTGQDSRLCHSHGHSSSLRWCSWDNRWHRCFPPAYRLYCFLKTRRSRWLPRGLGGVVPAPPASPKLPTFCLVRMSVQPQVSRESMTIHAKR